MSAKQTYMRVRVSAGSAVQIKDTCVEGLLVVQGEGHCIQTTGPVLSTWFLEQSFIFGEIDQSIGTAGLKKTFKK